MKRHGNLFEKITDIGNLYHAYYNARRGKRWQRAVIEFNENIDSNLLRIRDSMVDKVFTTSPYKTKLIHEPKEREIHILPFAPDRIVQHAIMNVIEPIWESLFIYDSYACRAGKGIHAGSRRAMDFIRQNNYCMQCDVAKFYPSIDHEILLAIIKKKIKCEDTLNLLQNIIHSIDGDKNVPIGNYTSQWFGNLYMNELDQYLKHEHKVKCYIRYCDDFVIFHNSKELLNKLAFVINDFAETKLKLRLKKCSIFPVSQGLDFLGYRHFRNYILLRKSTTKRVIKRLRNMPRALEEGKLTRDQLRSSLASTQGWLRWANTHNLQLKLEMDKLRGGYVLEYKKFGDFAKESAILDGNKLSMSEIINREILIIGYRLAESKYSKNNNPKCLTLHIELDAMRFVVFTGSVILIEQIEKYKDEIPFLATIKQIDKYYTFS